MTFCTFGSELRLMKKKFLLRGMAILRKNIHKTTHEVPSWAVGGSVSVSLPQCRNVSKTDFSILRYVAIQYIK